MSFRNFLRRWWRSGSQPKPQPEPQPVVEIPQAAPRALPQFGMNNPHPYWEEAAECGVTLAKKLPHEWSGIEPFRPLAGDRRRFTIDDFGLGDLPSKYQPFLEKHFRTTLARLKGQPVDWQQDSRGRWHAFFWHATDRYVREAQQHGIDVTFLMHMRTLWASNPRGLAHAFERRDTKGAHLSPTRPEADADLQFFIQCMVERYGTGPNAMPGLKRPVLLWCDGNEYDRRPFFLGSPEDHLRMWRAFSSGVRAGNPDALVLSNGIADVRDIRKGRCTSHASGFFRVILDHPELYDVFCHHVYSYVLRDPDRIREDAKFIRQEMAKREYTKPVAVLECSGAYLGDLVAGKDLRKTLQNPQDDQHAKTLKWYDQELAREIVAIHCLLCQRGVQRDALPFSRHGDRTVAGQQLCRVWSRQSRGASGTKTRVRCLP